MYVSISALCLQLNFIRLPSQSGETGLSFWGYKVVPPTPVISRFSNVYNPNLRRIHHKPKVWMFIIPNYDLFQSINHRPKLWIFIIPNYYIYSNLFIIDPNVLGIMFTNFPGPGWSKWEFFFQHLTPPWSSVSHEITLHQSLQIPYKSLYLWQFNCLLLNMAHLSWDFPVQTLILHSFFVTFARE